MTFNFNVKKSEGKGYNRKVLRRGAKVHDLERSCAVVYKCLGNVKDFVEAFAANGAAC